ncbi:MAG: hypothetical protein AB7P40_22735 [Chloroflexota bacterium]
MLKRRVSRSRRAVLTGLALAPLSMLFGCWPGPRTETLHGVVVEMQAASFSQVAGFTLRTDAGEDYEFIVEGDIGFTPSHLRQHMLLGERVAVTAKSEADLRIATRVEDAPAQ